jgi:hypothetical protein
VNETSNERQEKLFAMRNEAKTLEELNEKVALLWTEGTNCIEVPNLTPNEMKLIPRDKKGEPTNGWSSKARVKRGRLLPIPNINEMEDWEVDVFVEDFEYYWEQGLGAKEIAKEMQFKRDENGDAPWSPLELWHVYYFAKRLGLPPRHRFQKKVVKSKD